MAVLYVWCQLNKSKFRMDFYDNYKFKWMWCVTFAFRYASPILFRYSTSSSISAMGTLSFQYDCQRRWNDRTYRYFCRTRLLFPQIPICPGFWWPRSSKNTTGNLSIYETHSKCIFIQYLILVADWIFSKSTSRSFWFWKCSITCPTLCPTPKSGKFLWTWTTFGRLITWALGKNNYNETE